MWQIESDYFKDDRVKVIVYGQEGQGGRNKEWHLRAPKQVPLPTPLFAILQVGAFEMQASN